jgi:hypothetical protein
MTTQAPAPSVAQEVTEQLQATGDEPVLDAFRLLDHRSRRTAVSERMARRGPYLALRDGDQTRLVALEPKLTHLGRGTGCELRFEDVHVSRSHAIIVRHGRFTRLLDNRSANGTFLNGRRIVATNVAHGDLIRLGPVVMQYVEIG